MIILDLAKQQTRNFTHSNFEMSVLSRGAPAYPQHQRAEVSQAIGEAWQWLLNEGLMMTAPDQPNGWFCVTRKGRGLAAVDVDTYKQGDLLPASMRHAALAKVRPMFPRGEYDVAVLQAFIAAEEAVRVTGKYGNSDIGSKLMQGAFNADNGPLTDTATDRGERVGLMDLFSGAIGFCKNPSSHRTVGIERVTAAQSIPLASDLLMVVVSRKKP